MKKLIFIYTIYHEQIIRVELKRTKNGVYTDKGFIPFSDIEYIEEIGEIL